MNKAPRLPHPYCNLRDEVCRKHAITTKMFYEQNSLLVREAREDFMRRAYCDYSFSLEEIAKVLTWDLRRVKHEIRQVIGQSNAGTSPARTDKAAGPFSFDKEELHTGPAVALSYDAHWPHPAIVGFIWGRPEKRSGAIA